MPSFQTKHSAPLRPPEPKQGRSSTISAVPLVRDVQAPKSKDVNRQFDTSEAAKSFATGFVAPLVLLVSSPSAALITVGSTGVFLAIAAVSPTWGAALSLLGASIALVMFVSKVSDFVFKQFTAKNHDERERAFSDLGGATGNVAASIALRGMGKQILTSTRALKIKFPQIDLLLSAGSKEVEQALSVARNRLASYEERVNAMKVLAPFFEKTPPGEPKPIADLAMEAHTWSHKVSNHSTAFRFDSRTPDVIAAAGFQPNPGKPVGTFVDHFAAGSGTSSLVSLSSAPGTQSVLLMHSVKGNISAPANPRIHAEHDTYVKTMHEVFRAVVQRVLKENPALSEQEASTRVENFLIQQSVANGIKFDLQFRGYEYATQNVRGVGLDPKQLAGYAHSKEHEILAPSVGPEQVLAYRQYLLSIVREGYHALDGTLLGDKTVAFGKWKPARNTLTSRLAAFLYNFYFSPKGATPIADSDFLPPS